MEAISGMSWGKYLNVWCHFPTRSYDIGGFHYWQLRLFPVEVQTTDAKILTISFSERQKRNSHN
jgi:hypothetical protein